MSEPAVVDGHTCATAQSIEGIRGFLWLSVCPTIESLHAEDVPKGFDPKSLARASSAPGETAVEPIRYEIWTVRGCGRACKVFIALWNDTNGVERFDVIPPKGWLDGS
jgi:hypothetical protein